MQWTYIYIIKYTINRMEMQQLNALNYENLRKIPRFVKKLAPSEGGASNGAVYRG